MYAPQSQFSDTLSLQSPLQNNKLQRLRHWQTWGIHKHTQCSQEWGHSQRLGTFVNAPSLILATCYLTKVLLWNVKLQRLRHFWMTLQLTPETRGGGGECPTVSCKTGGIRGTLKVTLKITALLTSCKARGEREAYCEQVGCCLHHSDTNTCITWCSVKSNHNTAQNS